MMFMQAATLITRVLMLLLRHSWMCLPELLKLVMENTLQSTSEDNVFMLFSDHGAPGLIAFPGSAGTLHKQELQSTFQTMSDNNMFNKLTFDLESCKSSSMFEDMNIPNLYALSAANPTESSWGSYCG